jgi:hypothetical protein
VLSARYAQREAQSSKALEFRGSNTVVSGATAWVVILAIVCVVVLRCTNALGVLV